MKLINKPIDMIAITNKDGYIQPCRFKYPCVESPININAVEFCDEDKHNGNRVLIYRCRSMVDGKEMNYELKFDIPTCKWFLYKM